MSDAAPRLGVLGAGAIGGFLALIAASGGARVVAVAREPLRSVLGRGQASPLGGAIVRPEPGRLVVADSSEALAGVDLCLVGVKRPGLDRALDELADLDPPPAAIVALQNGLGVAEQVAARWAGPAAVAVVGFNVVVQGERWTQQTDSPLYAATLPARAPLRAQQAHAAWLGALTQVGVAAALDDDLSARAAGKLLLNLNNGVCAVAGVPIRASLTSRALRRCYGLALREGLAIMRAADRPVRRIGRVSPRLVARIIDWPDWLVLRLARALLRIEPTAKSSTLVDLERGRPVEIEALNGAIVELAAACGRTAPVNAWLTAQVLALAQAGSGRVHPTPAAMLEALTGLAAPAGPTLRR